MDEIYQALSSCDLFVAIGTSGNVYPAAGFVQMANKAGANTLEINLERCHGFRRSYLWQGGRDSAAMGRGATRYLATSLALLHLLFLTLNSITHAFFTASFATLSFGFSIFSFGIPVDDFTPTNFAM